MRYSAILLCGGNGNRFKNTIFPNNTKIFIQKNKIFLINQLHEKFIIDDDCKQIIFVYNKNDLFLAKKVINTTKTTFVEGGLTRAKSCYLALNYVSENKVIIHDGARFFCTTNLIEKIKLSLKSHHSVIPICPITDSLKQINNHMVVKTFSKSQFVFAQTPQGFTTSLLKECYTKLNNDKAIIWENIYDCSMLVEMYSNLQTKTVLGEISNKKITTNNDWEN